MEVLKGVFPPITTIFDENGKIDMKANKKHIDFLITKGVDGIAFLGTSGEFFSITLEEKKIFILEVIKYINKRTKILVGVGNTNKDEVKDFIEFLNDKEINGILLINPYFAVYDEKEVEAYYHYMSNLSKHNIIIYNFPQLTGFNFTPNFVEKLVLENENIVGIKDTIADQWHLIDMLKIKKKKENFLVYCAFESQAFGALVNGIDGFINATANFAPEFTIGLWKNYQINNLIECKVFYEKMCEAMEVYKLSSPLALACKAAVYERVLGYEGTEKLPALPLTKENKENLKNILINLNLI